MFTKIVGSSLAECWYKAENVNFKSKTSEKDLHTEVSTNRKNLLTV